MYCAFYQLNLLFCCLGSQIINLIDLSSQFLQESCKGFSYHGLWRVYWLLGFKAYAYNIYLQKAGTTFSTKWCGCQEKSHLHMVFFGLGICQRYMLNPLSQNANLFHHQRKKKERTEWNIQIPKHIHIFKHFAFTKHGLHTKIDKGLKLHWFSFSEYFICSLITS